MAAVGSFVPPADAAIAIESLKAVGRSPLPRVEEEQSDVPYKALSSRSPPAHLLPASSAGL